VHSHCRSRRFAAETPKELEQRRRRVRYDGFGGRRERQTAGIGSRDSFAEGADVLIRQGHSHSNVYAERPFWRHLKERRSLEDGLAEGRRPEPPVYAEGKGGPCADVDARLAVGPCGDDRAA
jgi:hypothetical protein